LLPGARLLRRIAVRIDRRLIGLGLFLLTAGVVMLVIRQGVVSADIGQRAWTLWPLILVGAGLSIILAGRPGAAIGGLVVAVTLGAMLGGLAATGWGAGFAACGGDRTGTPFQEQNGNLSSGTRVSISFSCGQLRVGSVAGSTWSVSGSSTDGRPPKIDEDDGIEIDAQSQGVFELGSGRNDWTVVVPRDAGIDLDLATNGGASDVALGGVNLGDTSFETNAGSLTVDLRDVAAIGDLDLRTNFGSLVLHLPTRSVAATLSVNAGSAAVCVPDGIGLRVTLGGVAASNDLADRGLVRVGDAWETPDYATAAERVTLDVSVNAGSLAIDPVRECAG
jgi:hypothetical protein